MQPVVKHEPIWTLAPKLGVRGRRDIPRAPRFFRFETLQLPQQRALSTLNPDDCDYILQGLMRLRDTGKLSPRNSVPVGTPSRTVNRSLWDDAIREAEVRSPFSGNFAGPGRWNSALTSLPKTLHKNNSCGERAMSTPPTMQRLAAQTRPRHASFSLPASLPPAPLSVHSSHPPPKPFDSVEGILLKETATAPERSRASSRTPAVLEVSRVATAASMPGSTIASSLTRTTKLETSFYNDVERNLPPSAVSTQTPWKVPENLDLPAASTQTPWKVHAPEGFSSALGKEEEKNSSMKSSDVSEPHELAPPQHSQSLDAASTVFLATHSLLQASKVEREKKVLELRAEMEELLKRVQQLKVNGEKEKKGNPVGAAPTQNPTLPSALSSESSQTQTNHSDISTILRVSGVLASAARAKGILLPPPAVLHPPPLEQQRDIDPYKAPPPFSLNTRVSPPPFQSPSTRCVGSHSVPWPVPYVVSKPLPPYKRIGGGFDGTLRVSASSSKKVSSTHVPLSLPCHKSGRRVPRERGTNHSSSVSSFSSSADGEDLTGGDDDDDDIVPKARVSGRTTRKQMGEGKSAGGPTSNTSGKDEYKEDNGPPALLTPTQLLGILTSFGEGLAEDLSVSLGKCFLGKSALASGSAAGAGTAGLSEFLAERGGEQKQKVVMGHEIQPPPCLPTPVPLSSPIGHAPQGDPSCGNTAAVTAAVAATAAVLSALDSRGLLHHRTTTLELPQDYHADAFLGSRTASGGGGGGECLCTACVKERELLDFLSQRVSAAETASEANRDLVQTLVAQADARALGSLEMRSIRPPHHQLHHDLLPFLLDLLGFTHYHHYHHMRRSQPVSTESKQILDQL